MSILRVFLVFISICVVSQGSAQLRSVATERVMTSTSEDAVYKGYHPDIWVNIRLDETDNLRQDNIDTRRNECGNISFDPALVRACLESSDFQVTYTGFTSEPQAAFQYAVDLWSNVLDIDVPIKVDARWSPLPAGVLGSAGATWIWDLGDGITYPSALGDQLIGADIHTLAQWQTTDPWYDSPDMEVRFSSNFSDWYFGLDGCPGPGQIDFVTVVMHEIAHGLGIFSSDRYFGPFQPIPELGGFSFTEDVFCIGFGAPFIFDTFLESSKVNLGLDGCFFEDGFLTSDSLVFIGPETQACFGDPPFMYAPPIYDQGSSVSHFDEDRYPGAHKDALLTPFVGRGEAVHDPGCALAVLRDLGYRASDGVERCTIPTMKEWGVISLFILLLIFGITAIKQDAVFIEHDIL